MLFVMKANDFTCTGSLCQVFQSLGCAASLSTFHSITALWEYQIRHGSRVIEISKRLRVQRPRLHLRHIFPHLDRRATDSPTEWHISVVDVSSTSNGELCLKSAWFCRLGPTTTKRRRGCTTLFTFEGLHSWFRQEVDSSSIAYHGFHRLKRLSHCLFWLGLFVVHNCCFLCLQCRFVPAHASERPLFER